MNKVDEQIQHEMQSVTRGVERFYAQLHKDVERGSEYDGPVGSRMINDCMAVFIPEIKLLQREAARKIRESMTTGRRLAGWELPIRALHPTELAYITLRTVLSWLAHENDTWTFQARRVGAMCRTQMQFNELKRLERERKAEKGGYNRISILKRQVAKINPRVARKWINQLDDLVVEDWPNDQRVKLGAILTEALVRSLPDVFEFREHFDNTKGKPRSIKRIVLTQQTQKDLDEAYQAFALRKPWLTPMVCTPKPWTLTRGGGYLRFPMPFVKQSWQLKSTSRPSQTVVDAINRIQEVPYAINARVLDVAKACLEARRTSVLPVAPLEELPMRVDDDSYEAMTKDEKSALSQLRREIHGRNNRLESRRQTMHRQIEVSQDLVAEPAIYFPHQVDFRGRAYPLPQDLHPQADDMARGLLRFAERKQLGPRGLIWLLRHLANTYGEDKASHEEQVQWALDMQDWIMTVAEDPLGEGYEFWRLAEEPWQFLAAAIEFDGAMKLTHPDEYWSALPIHVDGSCNGLQHLSAMGLDEVGAHAVNLTADPERQDIYGIVADAVIKSVPFDNPWYGHVTRKTVKRGVMTTPYGLTPAGMSNQLIQDRLVDGLPGNPRQLATYMRDRMTEALEGTIEKAKATMDWLQDNASILADENLELVWRSPSGFEVRQAYYTLVPGQFTIMGVGRPSIKVSLHNPDETQGIRKGKQVQATAPNVIHSFDAAHMALTVAAAPDDLFISVVHDSYGCHACDMDELLGVIKLTFVDIYTENWFALLQEDLEACAAQVEGMRLLPPPSRGAFDITEVFEAEYFFS